MSIFSVISMRLCACEILWVHLYLKGIFRCLNKFNPHLSSPVYRLSCWYPLNCSPQTKSCCGPTRNPDKQPSLLLETYCGFRQGRGTGDMIFTVRQRQEKRREQNLDLYITFVDLTKAFDTVNRDGLWKIMSKFGWPVKFINIVLFSTMAWKPQWMTIRNFPSRFQSQIG